MSLFGHNISKQNCTRHLQLYNPVLHRIQECWQQAFYSNCFKHTKLFQLSCSLSLHISCVSKYKSVLPFCPLLLLPLFQPKYSPLFAHLPPVPASKSETSCSQLRLDKDTAGAGLHVGWLLQPYLCLSAAELWTRWLQCSLGLGHCTPHNWYLEEADWLIMQRGLFLCIESWSY